MARDAAELRALTQAANDKASKAQTVLLQARALAEEATQQYQRISEKLESAAVQSTRAEQLADEAWQALSIAIDTGTRYMVSL
jgi:hypothetical protein